MGLDIYFINETKKQIVGSKYLQVGFEDEPFLMAYLACCDGDTIRIVNETNELIESEVFGHGKKEYTTIDSWNFSIPADIDKRNNEPYVSVLRDLVYSK